MVSLLEAVVLPWANGALFSLGGDGRLCRPGAFQEAFELRTWDSTYLGFSVALMTLSIGILSLVLRSKELGADEAFILWSNRLASILDKPIL